MVMVFQIMMIRMSMLMMSDEYDIDDDVDGILDDDDKDDG